MPSTLPPPFSTSTSTTPSTRDVIFPVEDSDDCSSALRWAIEHVAKPGDVFHLAHVQQHCGSSSGGESNCNDSPLFRSSPPSPHSFASGEDPRLAARGELVASQAMISRRFIPLLEQAKIPHEVHLLEPPPSSSEERGRSKCDRVGECLEELASRLRAALVIVGGGGGGSGGGGGVGSGSCAGSVTKFCLDRLPATVCVVRGDWETRQS